MEERPAAIEISPGDDESPWEDKSDNAGSDGTLLSGNVTSLGDDGSGVLGSFIPDEESKGLSNGAWFAIGLILAPGAMWLSSFILIITGESLPWELSEIFFLLAWALWPVGLIGGLIWSFTKGNNYFAYGLLTTLVAVPAVLFLALIAFIFSLGI